MEHQRISPRKPTAVCSTEDPHGAEKLPLSLAVGDRCFRDVPEPGAQMGVHLRPKPL